MSIKIKIKAGTVTYQRKIRIKQEGPNDSHLWNCYGIRLSKYRELFQKQNGNCAICGVNQSRLKKALAVDHCHKSKSVRGLLCDSCNLGIGRLRDDVLIVEAALKYLKKYLPGDSS